MESISTKAIKEYPFRSRLLLKSKGPEQSHAIPSRGIRDKTNNNISEPFIDCICCFLKIQKLLTLFDRRELRRRRHWTVTTRESSVEYYILPEELTVEVVSYLANLNHFDLLLRTKIDAARRKTRHQIRQSRYIRLGDMTMDLKDPLGLMTETV